MKIYDYTRTKIIEDLDLSKGYLIEDKVKVGERPSLKVETINEDGSINSTEYSDLAIYEDIMVYISYTENQLDEIKINEIKRWFDAFYRSQLEQCERAQRTNTEWSASDGENEYSTLAELDAEANKKQNKIRSLKIEQDKRNQFK